MTPIFIRLSLCAAQVALGFGVAWYVQSLRIESCQYEHTDLISRMRAEVAESSAGREKITQESENAWHKNLEALHDYYRQRPVVKRVLLSADRHGSAIPAPAGSVDAAVADAAPITGGDALAEQCADTTLQCRELQRWIERQLSTNP